VRRGKMIQKNEVLTREDNRTSTISAKQTTAQADPPIIADRKPRVNTTEQTWRLKLCEETRVGRATPKLRSFLVEIIQWLYYLGSGKIDDALLESRQKNHHNLTTKGIGL
jgi:hypothetical protein